MSQWLGRRPAGGARAATGQGSTLPCPQQPAPPRLCPVAMPRMPAQILVHFCGERTPDGQPQRRCGMASPQCRCSRAQRAAHVGACGAGAPLSQASPACKRGAPAALPACSSHDQPCCCHSSHPCRCRRRSVTHLRMRAPRSPSSPVARCSQRLALPAMRSLHTSLLSWLTRPTIERNSRETCCSCAACLRLGSPHPLLQHCPVLSAGSGSITPGFRLSRFLQHLGTGGSHRSHRHMEDHQHGVY